MHETAAQAGLSCRFAAIHLLRTLSNTLISFPRPPQAEKMQANPVTFFIKDSDHDVGDALTFDSAQPTDLVVDDVRVYQYQSRIGQ